MRFRVDYFDAKGLTGSDVSFTNLELAKAMAEKSVASGTAERAEVRDEGGQLLFHHPRTLRSA